MVMVMVRINILRFINKDGIKSEGSVSTNTKMILALVEKAAAKNYIFHYCTTSYLSLSLSHGWSRSDSKSKFVIFFIIVIAHLNEHLINFVFIYHCCSFTV